MTTTDAGVPIEKREIKTVTLLTNPAAGHGTAPEAAERALARFQQRGVDVVHIVGADADQAAKLARGAIADKAADAFAVAGGDGVIGIALQTLANTDVPLGVIPAGTGNDTARAYGIPLGDPELAADIIMDGWVRKNDLGFYQGDDGTEKWYGTILATGFDAAVSDRVNNMTWPNGRRRYDVAMLIEMAKLHTWPYTLTLDDNPPFHVDAVQMAVGNTNSFGGGALMTPNADFNDGLLDLTVVVANRRQMLAGVPKIYKGEHIYVDGVSTYRAHQVRIESPGNAYADGDLIGPLPGVATAVKDADRTIVPGPSH